MRRHKMVFTYRDWTSNLCENVVRKRSFQMLQWIYGCRVRFDVGRSGVAENYVKELHDNSRSSFQKCGFYVP